MATGGSNWSNTLLCRRRDFGGVACVALTGELDLATVSTLSGQMNAVAETEDHLILDLGELRYIDSTGIKAMLDAHRAFARRGRRLALAAVSAMVLKILRVVGVDKMIPIFPTVDAALRDLGGDGTSTRAP
ncbi:MAG TPA: STAS domain-containing protein [bacterium]|nr:STAS domain-containing protein [bacterium]